MSTTTVGLQKTMQVLCFFAYQWQSCVGGIFSSEGKKVSREPREACLVRSAGRTGIPPHPLTFSRTFLYNMSWYSVRSQVVVACHRQAQSRKRPRSSPEAKCVVTQAVSSEWNRVGTGVSFPRSAGASKCFFGDTEKRTFPVVLKSISYSRIIPPFSVPSA